MERLAEQMAWLDLKWYQTASSCKHIWTIRHHLKTEDRIRDLALFNCAIDAKLRGCDLVKLKVSDIAPGCALRDRVGHRCSSVNKVGTCFMPPVVNRKRAYERRRE